MYTLDNSSRISISILLLCFLILLLIAYIKQGKIIKEMEREERSKKEKQQMNES